MDQCRFAYIGVQPRHETSLRCGNPIDADGLPRTVTDMTREIDRQPTLTDLARRLETAADPLDRLGHIRLLREALKATEDATVQEARAADASWTAIGESLGVSKQAAAQRFGVRPQPTATSAGETSASPRRQTGNNAWEVTSPGGRTLLRIRRGAR